MLQSWFGENRDVETRAERSDEAQAAIDRETAKLALYHYDTCWFCGRVRAAIERLALKIELRNIHADPKHYEKLLREGGSGTVPCLYIELGDGAGEWLYESKDIIEYLERRFA